jgi:hypothetical protein
MNKKVTIIGGGTAGYMSAAAFNHLGYDVTIIYNNTENPRLVVGESLTANTFLFLEQVCGFKRAEWILGSDAIHKNGVMYKDWGKQGEVYINGWRRVEHNPSDYIRDKDKTYHEVVKDELYVDQLNDTNKTLFSRDDIDNPVGFIPIEGGERLTQNAGTTPYGIQLDALQLTDFIQKKLGDSITTIQDRVAEVAYEGTRVVNLTLDSGKVIDTELVIDASGFAKVVAKTSPLFQEEDISDIVFTNRALFHILEYKDREAEMKPRTGTLCGNHGWAWHTPTAKRIGTGYVFNSNYCSDELALEDYCKTLGVEMTDDIREGVAYINFPSKRTKDVLMDNILCVGMSSGFIEPMEAPSLLGVQLTLQYFFLDKDSSQQDYNRKIADYVRSMTKFIGIRYKTSAKRDTPFWKYVHQDSKCQYITDVINRFNRDGYIADKGYDTGVCMPPRCFDDLIRSSISPNVPQGHYKYPDNITMAEYLDILKESVHA